jgi:hypothetical protein
MSHDDLRAKAKAATPGPWEAGENHNDEPCVYADNGNRWIAVLPHLCVTPILEMAQADAAFIAAASPDVVLGLLDEIERLRRIEAAARAFFSQPYDNGQYEAALAAELRRQPPQDNREET